MEDAAFSHGFPLEHRAEHLYTTVQLVLRSLFACHAALHSSNSKGEISIATKNRDFQRFNFLSQLRYPFLNGLRIPKPRHLGRPHNTRNPSSSLRFRNAFQRQLGLVGPCSPFVGRRPHGRSLRGNDQRKQSSATRNHFLLPYKWCLPPLST